MSIYATFDENPGEQIASNKGWGDFCRWGQTVGGVIGTLANTGEAKVEPLLAALESENTPADVSGLNDTVAGFVNLLKNNASESHVFITDGMSK